MSRRRADELGIVPLARFIAFAYAGCDPEEMGIGPIHAIPKVLKMAGLTLDDIGVIELNEAFAAQSLAVIKVLGIDPAKLNPQRRSHRPGPPLRLHRHQAHRHPPPRHAQTPSQVRHGDDVRWRRHGRRRNL